MPEQLDPQEREKLELSSHIGIEADRALEGDIFDLVVNAGELECINRWLHSKPEEKQLREDLYYEARALGKMRRRLTNARAKGKSATDTLEEHGE